MVKNYLLIITSFCCLLIIQSHAGTIPYSEGPIKEQENSYTEFRNVNTKDCRPYERDIEVWLWHDQEYLE